MKVFSKKILAISVIVGMIGLTACSHEDPLKTQPQLDTIHFLEAASAYATKKMEDKMDFNILDPRETYTWCIDGHFEKKDPKFCPEFYDYMIDYAKSSDTPYKNVNRKDLEDKKFVFSIWKAYWHDRINHPYQK